MWNLTYNSEMIFDLFECPVYANIAVGNGISIFQSTSRDECLKKIDDLKIDRK